jgi:hypothetical protein
MFQKVLECSKMIQEVPEGSRRFWNVPEDSRILQKICSNKEKKREIHS